MALLPRLRRRPVKLEGTELVEKAIAVAMKPDSLKELSPGARDQVDELVKAISVGSGYVKKDRFRAAQPTKPNPAAVVAARAHQVLGPSSTITPVEIAVALQQQGLDFVEPFAPGTPLQPFYGYGRRPRQYDYTIGRNVTTETRPDRIPFSTLEQLYDGYDVARICTRHAINSLRSMCPPRFEAVDGYDGKNPTKEIAEARKRLRRPDGKRLFPNWLAMNMLNLWKFDSAPIFRMRDQGGNVTRLLNVSAKTIAPMLDYYGDYPDGDAPAFQQFIEGVPWDWLKWSDLIYEPFWPETDSPYGTPPLETVLINANTDVRLQIYFLQFFTSGSVPEAFAIAPEGMTSGDDIADFEEQYYSYFQGDQSERWGLHWLPNGTDIQFYKPQMFDPDLAEYVMRRTVSAYLQTPHNLGFTDDVNRACYSDDTEVLTEHGWKRHDEVGTSERIATLNPATQAIEYHAPIAHHAYPFDGEMVHFASRQVDVLVTPEHRMWAGNRSNELPRGRSGAVRPTWEMVEAKGLASRGGFWFADTATWDQGDEVDAFALPGVAARRRGGRLAECPPDRVVGMDTWLEFLGYIVSEGCIFGDASDGRYKVSVSQNVRANPEKVRTIDACLAELPFAFRSYDDKGETRRWQLSDKSLWTWLRENIGRYSGDKHLPAMWRDLGKRQLSILFEALMLGDGSTDPRPGTTNRGYFTKSPVLAGEVQEVAIRLGYRAQTRFSEGARVHVVSISEPNRLGYQLRWSKNVTREHYAGTVWCFTVQNHLFFTRRNGKVAIHGNSGDTQMDVQFRVTDIPTVGYYQDLIDSVLQDDWSLPVQLRFDTGRDREDRLIESQAMTNYWRIGAISSDEIREKVVDLPINPDEKIPRVIMDERLGIIPLAHAIAISGEIDPLTAAPKVGSVKPIPFQLPGGGTPVPGAGPQPPAPNTGGSAAPAAGAGPKVSDPTKAYPRPLAPPSASKAALPTDAQTGDARPAQPLGSGSPDNVTGNVHRYGDPGYGMRGVQGSTANGTAALVDPEGEDDEAEDLRKWRRQAARRVGAGKSPRIFSDSAIRPALRDRVWTFLETATDREQVESAFKSAEPKAGGIAVQAEDTGRVLLIQRTPDHHDPAEARARWEFPGGKLDGGEDGGSESAWEGAYREWSEETGAALPEGFEPQGSWLSPDGVYQGFVVTVPSEADLNLDPDPDESSDARWWSKDDLDSPQVRDKVTDTLHLVAPLLKSWSEQPRNPLGRWSTHHELVRQDLHRDTDAIIDHFTPLIEQAMAAVIPQSSIDQALRAAYGLTKAAQQSPNQPPLTPAQQAAVAAGTAGLAVPGAMAGVAGASGAISIGLAQALLALAAAPLSVVALAAVLRLLYAAAYLAGSRGASDASDGSLPPWVSTLPGTDWHDATEALSLAQGGLADVLRDADTWIKEMTTTEVNRVGDALREAVEHGSPLSEARAAIDSIVHDENRARLIAETEYARAQTVAARETYRHNGVPYVQWLHQPDACPACMENADVSPIPVTERWPSGNVPVHPRCRCAEAPSEGPSHAHRG